MFTVYSDPEQSLMNICIKQASEEADPIEYNARGTRAIVTAPRGPRPSINSIFADVPVANGDPIAACHGDPDLKKIQDRLADIAHDPSSGSGLKRLMALWTVHHGDTQQGFINYVFLHVSNKNLYNQSNAIHSIPGGGLMVQ
jgi:hypothetical protein